MPELLQQCLPTLKYLTLNLYERGLSAPVIKIHSLILIELVLVTSIFFSLFRC